ncbi:MAG: hypothetical protein R6V05_07580, partial [Candidatus Brocadiia bacterium]
AEEIEMPVQVNGTVRARITVERDQDEEQVRALAMEQPNVQAHLGDGEISKIVVVPNRIVNIVVG